MYIFVLNDDRLTTTWSHAIMRRSCASRKRKGERRRALERSAMRAERRLIWSNITLQLAAADCVTVIF